MRGCARARTQLLQEVDGDLSLDQRLQLDAHLARCAACRAEREALAAIEEALAGLPEPPLESLDLEREVSAVRARLALPAAQDAREPRRAPAAAPARAPARPWRAAAAAAALACAAGLAYLATRDRGDARDERLAAAPPAAAPAAALPPAPEPAASESGAGEPATETSAPATSAPEPAAPDGAAAEPAAQDGLDPARLDAARAEVGERLAAAFAGVPLLAGREEVEAAAQRFEADTAELARAWPRLRLAQGLAGHPDPALAGAALRYLGVRGDTIAASALRDALDRPALAPAAVAALGDLGADGLDGLALALRRPELCALAFGRVSAAGGPRAAGVLAEELERRARARRAGALEAEDAALLAALAAVRPCPVEALLDLAQRGLLPRAAVLDALAGAEGARDAVGALAAAGGGRVDRDLLLAAVAVLRPPAALSFVEEEATLRRGRDAAADCLAAYADEGALDVLVRLRTSGRARAELVIGASARLLAANPAAAVDLARRADGPEGEARSSALLELLLEVGTRDTAPGLAALAFAPALPAEERTWAALALGEVGDARSADALAQGLAGATDAKLAAACLLAANALGARDAALDALARRGALEPRLAQRLSELCDEAGRDGMRVVTLHRVARELRTLIDDRSRDAAAGTP